MNRLLRHFKKLKANQDIRDNINEWVEDTLFNVILRKRYDHSDKDKKLLYLYRLLAIKYRVVFPLKGESFKLDEDLRIVLETKICNAAMIYFNAIPDGYKPSKTKQAVTSARASAQTSANTRTKSANNSRYQSTTKPTSSMKVGRAPAAHHKYDAPLPEPYYSAEQYAKYPANNAYASTVMPTTSAVRQPSTERHVRFENDDREDRQATVPQPMTASGVSMKSQAKDYENEFDDEMFLDD